MWLLLKQLHVVLAALTAAGFVVRGVWMLGDSPMLRRQWVRIAPHVIDTLLLASGVVMAFGLSISPMAHPWLAAKLAAVVFYIVLGTVALKRGRTRRARAAALVAALVVLAYVAAVAVTRDPLPLG